VIFWGRGGGVSGGGVGLWSEVGGGAGSACLPFRVDFGALVLKLAVVDACLHSENDEVVLLREPGTNFGE
jgi:hypothetical protein